MGLLGKIFGRTVISYEEIGPEFVIRIARSLELPEWSAGSLPKYSSSEQSSIDEVFDRFAKMTASIAEENGAQQMSFHPDVAEPLKRVLFEAGLSNSALYRWRAFPMEVGGIVLPIEVDTSGPPDEWKEIASTYAKCYLCNLNPFSFLRLAQLLFQCGRKQEGSLAAQAVRSFVTFASRNRPNRLDAIAYMSTSSFFADYDFASLYEDVGGYSLHAVGRLDKEAKLVS